MPALSEIILIILLPILGALCVITLQRQHYGFFFFFVICVLIGVVITCVLTVLRAIALKGVING